MTESNQGPLDGKELQALNTVGLHPEHIPQQLDEFILIFLREFAEVEVTPTDSSQLTGKYEAILGSGIASSFLSQGSTITGTSYVTGNIKQQTQVQEWIHWKKFALEHSKFSEWKASEEERYQRMYQTMASFIRSEKGKKILDWIDHRDTGTGIFALVVVVLLLFSPVITPIPFGVLLLVQLTGRAFSPNGLGHLIAKRMYDLPDIETLYPRGGINEDGELELE